MNVIGSMITMARQFQHCDPTWVGRAVLSCDPLYGGLLCWVWFLYFRLYERKHGGGDNVPWVWSHNPLTRSLSHGIHWPWSTSVHKFCHLLL